MSKLVILRRCATIEEALVIDSLLKDGGFYSHIGERHISHMQWDIIPALGGVTVWVRAERLLEAGEYIIDMRASAHERLESALGEYDTAPLKLRWGRALSMIFIQVGGGGLLGLLLAYLMSLLPIEWWSLSRSYYFGADYFSASTPAHGFAFGLKLDGILYALFVGLIFLWDVIDSLDKVRLARKDNNERDI